MEVQGAAVDPMATEGHATTPSTAQEDLVIRRKPRRRFPILSLRGLESSVDKKYLMQILDEKVPEQVFALQVVGGEDDKRFAFIQFYDLESAQLVLENGHWMPTHDVLALFRPCPDEEGCHRDKRPKNHRHHHHQLLLLPDVHISDTLRLNKWGSIATVERITVKHIKHGGTCAKIYGNVIAFDDNNQQVLFRRKPCESDAKTIGDDLELKGPHFSGLDPSPWGSIGINLFEDRGDGQERVFARGLIGLEEGGYFKVDVEGDGGVVSVVYASVQYAVWAQVCVGGLQNLRVCGCIKARREIEGVQSEFLMFAKSSDNCVYVGPDGVFRLDRSVVVASKRAGLTISVSLDLCHGDDDERTWCVVQKDLVFDAVFKKEAQSIHGVFGGKVTVSLAYNDTPDLHCTDFDPYDDDEDEWGVGGQLYDDTMEVIQKHMSLLKSCSR